MTAGDDRDLAVKEPLAWDAVELAPEVICAVRDCDRPTISRLLDPLDRQQLYALVVVLAAAFDPDNTRFRTAVAWADPDPADPHPNGAVATQPCGTHAAFIRHKKRGEEPDRHCVEGERVYQHNRHLRRTGRAVAC
jgi:hypothetical protein